MANNKRQSIKAQTIILSLSRALVTGMRFVLPMLLVRMLAEETFGVYRLVWLMVLSAEIIAPLGIPRSLLFFVPKLSGDKLNRYIYQSLYLLIGLGIVAGGVTYLCIQNLQPLVLLQDFGLLIAGFVGCWISSRMVEFLPIAEQRLKIQGFFLVGLEFARVSTITLIVFFSPSLHAIILGLTLFSLFRLLLQVGYLFANYAFPRSLPRLSEVKELLAFSVPMGASGFLDLFRKKLEHWVVAWLFTPVEFAIFSIGSINIPIVALLRRSLSQVITPRLSKNEVGGRDDKALALVQKANTYSAFIVFPLVAFLWVFADDVVTILFTVKYLAAVPVLKLYILVFLNRAIDVANLLLVYKQQVFMLRLNSVLLVVSLVVSIIGCKLFGITGAALGSVFCVFLQSVVVHAKALRLFGITLRKIQDWPKLFVIFLYSILSCGAGYSVSLFIDSGPLVRLLACGVASVISYVVLMYFSHCRSVLLGFVKRNKASEGI